MLPGDMDRCPRPADARLVGCPCDAGRPQPALPRRSPSSEWVPSHCSHVAVRVNDDRLAWDPATRARVRLQKGQLRCARPGHDGISGRLIAGGTVVGAHARLLRSRGAIGVPMGRGDELRQPTNRLEISNATAESRIGCPAALSIGADTWFA
jgi:hypothetical protein